MSRNIVVSIVGAMKCKLKEFLQKSKFWLCRSLALNRVLKGWEFDKAVSGTK
jgi:hypothetical protein